METIQLGHLLPPEERRRDAVHVAIAPVTAGEYLLPGRRIKLLEGQTDIVVPANDDDALGIIDPFLTHAVEKGQRCWICIPPGTITSLRHIWQHPAFIKAAEAVKERL